MDDRKCGLMPLRQLGWGFLLAWVFCVFYTNAAGAFEGMPRADVSGDMAAELFYTLLPLGSSVLMLAAILVAEPRLGAPTSHRRLLVAAPLLTAASTPFMFLNLADPLAEALVFAAGSLATGVGSALMWVMWGEYYAVLPRENAEGLAPASAVSAALLVLVVSATDGWVAVALASLFPLLSGWCFYLVWTPGAAREESALAQATREQSRRNRRDDERRRGGLGRTGFGILGVFSVVSIAGMLDQSEVQGLALQIILLASALMMAVVAVLALSGPRRISLAFLYRWMCPVLVIGFAAIILLGPQGGLVAFAASLAGRFTFCLIAQIYFASYAASGRATPTQATSWGWLFVHAGDLVGCTLWVAVAPVVAAAPDGAVWAATLCIVALVVVTMLTLNDTAVFHRVNFEEGSEGRETGDADAPPASLASQANAADPDEATAAASATPSPQSAATAPATSAEPDAVAALAADHRLTPRETEVFALLAQGRSIPFIRDELIISRETAATHAKHIYAKLGVHSRQELIDLVQKRETEG